MKNLKYFLPFVLTLLLNNCVNKKDQIENANVKTYRIENIDSDFFHWDKFIERIEVVQLETTPQSVIGNITEGIVDSSNIFLFDFRNKVLLKFDIGGKFIQKIGKIGKGPDEYLELRDFCIAGDYVYTLDYSKIHCYNKSNGNYIDSWSFNSNQGFNPVNFIVFNKDEYYLWNSNPDVWNQNSGNHYRMRKIKNGHVKEEYFKYKYHTSDDPRFYKRKDNTYFLRPIRGENVIYKVTPDSIIPSFQINFRDKAISLTQLEEIDKSKDPNAYYESDCFKEISNILEINDYIYFNCVGPNRVLYEGLILKSTGEIVIGRWDYKKSPHLFFSDGIFLYGYYDPSTILDKEFNSKQNSCFDSVKDNLKNVKISDNPILIKFYLRKP